MTLWAARASVPGKLAETQTNGDGHFDLPVQRKASPEVLYLAAKGGEPTIGGGKGANDAAALLAILGTDPAQRAVVNELTTVASVWTAAQFLDGAALSGDALGLRIAAGNVPNLVDLDPAVWGM